jgi:hypothetical protein
MLRADQRSYRGQSWVSRSAGQTSQTDSRLIPITRSTGAWTQALAQENHLDMLWNEAGAEGGRMMLVLVGEHEEPFSDALSYMLRKEGFEVVVCLTGPVRSRRSTATGRTWCCSISRPRAARHRGVRSLRERSDVPVIMLSAKDTEVDKAVGLELGTDNDV